MAKISSILCPVDFSDFSLSALRYAVSLGIHYQAQVVVHHAVAIAHTPYYGYMVPGNVLEDYQQSVLQQSEQAMQQLLSMIDHGPAQLRTVVTMGAVVGELLRLAEEQRSDLIVMGTHGRSGFERLLLGSVTEKVIRKSRCPVLAVGHTKHDFIDPDDKLDPIHLKRLMVAVDLSPHSQTTLQYARGLAAEYAAELHVVHVVEHSAYIPADTSFALHVPDFAEQLQQDAQLRMDEFLRQACPEDGGQMLSEVVVGLADREILRLAEEKNIDMLIMGARSGWMAGLVALGTTAHRILSHMQCPVLVLRC